MVRETDGVKSCEPRPDECRRCSNIVAEGTTHYCREWNHNICNGTEACTLRMPAGGRQARAPPEGGYA
eukprot:44357-Prymnesium_polylepis.1